MGSRHAKILLSIFSLVWIGQAVFRSWVYIKASIRSLACVSQLCVLLGEAYFIDKRDNRVETQTLFHTQSLREKATGGTLCTDIEKPACQDVPHSWWNKEEVGLSLLTDTAGMTPRERTRNAVKEVMESVHLLVAVVNSCQPWPADFTSLPLSSLSASISSIPVNLLSDLPSIHSRQCSSDRMRL